MKMRLERRARMPVKPERELFHGPRMGSTELGLKEYGIPEQAELFIHPTLWNGASWRLPFLHR
jgi:hypothetical protein